MKQKHRYILSGLCEGTDKISDFRLISVNYVRNSTDHAVRVNIPDDLVLEKYSCDSYSTTSDKRKLDELGWDIVVWERRKNKWIVHNELRGIQPCDI